MQIVIAMDSFKSTIPAHEACRIVAQAIAELVPDAGLSIKPMADGGEGTASAVLRSVGGQWVRRKVTGPLPDRTVNAGFAWFENTRTALVEMAAASGLQLLSPEQYNPMKTTTYGTGQLIKAALKRSPSRILLAVGGSATVDAGTGAAAALGWRFLDKNDNPIAPAGGGLHHIQRIVSSQDLRLPPVEVLCDVQNPLCGRQGAAAVYGPQKGATPQMVEHLQVGLAHLAQIARTQLDKNMDVPGAGAAGGLAAGAIAFMNANLVSGIEAVINFTGLEGQLVDADWVVTGEGAFDRQSLHGKVVSGIARLAARSNVPVAVIAGQVHLTPAEYHRIGVRTAVPCKPPHLPLEEAIANSRFLLHAAAKNFARQNLL